jgi:hypothetical protein
MKQKLTRTFLAMILGSTLFTACKKDEIEENDNEVITTMKLTFVPVGGGSSQTFQFRDADGPGGAAPTQDQIILAPSKTYNVTIQLLNETVSPPDDITLEVEAESEAHRFYYEPIAGSNITIAGLNNDPNGVPLGTTSIWSTGAVATGKVTVTLRHFPGTPPGKEKSDPVDSPKSTTDIEVVFDSKIQ